ncbi:MAG: CDP-glucose 4,6-dehydratase [Roseburia sp.]|nr:CDP-glucose 4,6-dehydratase [Roseburia sp.]
MKRDLGFYKGKRVLVTGHTGFKGSWLCRMLVMAGAKLTGYALEPPTDPSLFRLCGLKDQMHSVLGDIRDLEHLKKVIVQEHPEIIIHMAAQPIVRESYKNPVETYETNVMGTVNVLECIRQSDSVRSFVNVTTDKVYRNREWEWGYRENEELNGFDPYSNSKSCSELVTECYVNSFLRERGVAVSTVRAGNVIGGGDFAPDRIIPDCIRAVEEGRSIIVRNPHSIRPYQHVLEPVNAYLMVAKEQYENLDVAGSYNVGPEEKDCLSTGELVTLFCRKWKEVAGEEITWEDRYDEGPHEANFLKLDCAKLKKTFGWKPEWDINTAVEKTVEFSAVYLRGEDVEECMERQMIGFRF